MSALACIANACEGDASGGYESTASRPPLTLSRTMPANTQPKLRRYRRRPDRFVTAVQLQLDTDGLRYRKWGGEQFAKRGDWLVNNDGEVYTVEEKTFRRTYARLRPGVYVKRTPVWACVAASGGSIATQEGQTRYRKGDYLVFNDRNRTDGYAMSPAKFKAMYSLASGR